MDMPLCYSADRVLYLFRALFEVTSSPQCLVWCSSSGRRRSERGEAVGPACGALGGHAARDGPSLTFIGECATGVFVAWVLTRVSRCAKVAGW